MQYTISKDFFDIKDTQILCVFFDNGDYISLSGNELKEYKVNFYDKLVRCDNGFCAVAESGFIRLAIQKRAPVRDMHFLYDPDEYEADRKKYIERRCIESQITEIRFLDTLDWGHAVLGNIRAKKEGRYLLLEFFPIPSMGASSSDKHCVQMRDFKKEDISCINLDFDNGESFFVFDREIVDICLSFEEDITWDETGLFRCVSGGFIRLKLRKRYSGRGEFLFERHPKKHDFERRLCTKKGFAKHDINHLEISLESSVLNRTNTERVMVDDIKTNEEIAELEPDIMGEIGYVHEGGYAKKLKDGTIILTFGKGAKRTLAKQELKTIY